MERQVACEENRDLVTLWSFLVWVAVLGGILFVLLVVLRSFFPDAVRSGGSPWTLEIWAGSLGLAFVGVGGWFGWRHREDRTLLTALGCVVFLGLVWLSFVRQCGAAKWDFQCYFYAGKAILQGIEIYNGLGDFRYIYSPLLATIFSTVDLLPFHVKRQEALAYFIWSVTNFWAILIFLMLLVSALRMYGVRHPLLWVGVTAALLCNVPLQRTLVYSQINLHVANSILGFLLLYRRRPLWSGGLLAVAVLLKSSPLLLALPVLAERRWKVLLGFLLGGILLVGGSVAMAGIDPWMDFVHTFGEITSHGTYRDNSIQSIFMNMGRLFGFSAEDAVVLWAGWLASIVLVIGLASLAFRREYRAVFWPEEGAHFLEGALPYFLAAMLVVSPHLWEHHWVFMQLPFLLLIWRARKARLLAGALAAYALVFFVPTFDVFPLSYHRIVGLGLWVYLVRELSREESATAEDSATQIASQP